MIIFLTTTNHRYTHAAVQEALPSVRVSNYRAVFKAESLPTATYIFTDIDRLGFWEQELAADLFRLLRRAGCRVLNDPARLLQRYALLNRLHRLGINRFRAWRPDEGVLPDRFPVFLRTQAAHRGVLSRLLKTADEANKALQHALDRGFPLADLMFVEYCAEPVQGGVFWKHSVYSLGDAIIAGASVVDRSWVAKTGEKGLATEEQLLFEQQTVLQNAFAEKLRPAFEAAQIEYGRADFAIVDGRLAVYEINTNPYLALPTEHRTSIRTETLKFIRRSYLEALARLDSSYSSSRTIKVQSNRFKPGTRGVMP